MMGKRRAALARMERVIKRAKAKQAKADHVRVATAPSPPLASPPPPPLTAAERVRIDRWVAWRIFPYAPDRCLHCRRPIIYGAKWVELVNDRTEYDRDRARFHLDCVPVWRAEQEKAAKKAMGIKADAQ